MKEVLDNIVNSVADPIFVKDEKHRWVMLNDAFCKFMGHSRQELLGKSEYDYFPKEEADVFWKKDEEVFETGEENVNEESFTDFEGKRHKITTKKTLFTHPHTGKKYLVGIIRDITRQSKIEEMLRKSEKENRKIVEIMPDMIFRLGKNGEYIDIKASNEDKLALPREELLKKSIKGVLPREISSVMLNAIKKAIETKKIQIINYALEVPAGKKAFEMRILKFNEKEVLCFTRDITEQNERERKLEETSRRLDLALEKANGGLWEWNIESNDLYWSEDLFNLLGYSKEQFLGTIDFFNEKLHPDDFKRTRAAIESALKTGESYHVEQRVRKADGKYSWLDVRGQVIDDQRGKRMVGVGFDITERKKREQELRESEEKYRTLFNQSTEGIYLHDLEGRFLDVNEMACKQSGCSREELLGLTVFDVHTAQSKINQSKSELLQMWSKWKPGQRFDFELEHRHKDGTIYPVELSSGIVQYRNTNVVLVLVKDITERKKREKELQQREKLERIITTISTELLNANIEEIPAQITKALEEIGKFAGADRSYVFHFSPDKVTISNTFEWCAEGVSSEVEKLQGLSTKEYAWLMDKLKRFQNIIVPDVDFLSSDAKEEKKHWKEQGIKSLLVLPMVAGDSLKGFIGFDYIEKNEIWQDAIINLLRVAGDVICEALERKKAYEELKRSEQEKDLILNSTDEFISMMKTDGKIVWANKAFADDLNLEKPEEARGEYCYKLRFNREDQCPYCPSKKVIDTKKFFSGEVNSPDGRYWLVSLAPILNENGDPDKIIKIARDITERKESESKIIYQQNLLEGVINNISDVLAIQKPDYSIERYNQAGYDLLGETPEEVKGKKCYELIGRDRECEECATRKVLKSGKMEHLEKYFPELGVYLDCRSNPVKDENGVIIKIVEQLRDITEQKKAEKDLIESKRRLQKTEEIANLGSCEIEVSSGKLIWSDQTYRIFGYKPGEIEPTYETFLSSIHPQDRKKVDQTYTSSVAEGRGSHEIEHRIIKKDTGEIRYVRERSNHFRDSDGNIIRSIGMVQDITQLKKSEKEREKYRNQLLQSQKMEAVGTLAGGIAHDFNNIMTSIKVTAELLLEENLPQEVLSDIKEINNSSDRAKNLTQQLLQFSRKDKTHKEVINLNIIIENSLKMLRRIMPENIDIETTIEEDLWPVKAAPSNMEQVITNLAINSRDAMPDGGVLNIKTKNVKITSDNLPLIEMELGEYVQLTVRDNGLGMDEKTKEKIFEPFFTTKGVKAGTGLGLPVVYGIVKDSGGYVVVETSPGEGTAINIFLPLTKRLHGEYEEHEKEANKKNSENRYSEIGVLIIEDEIEVMKTVRRVLDKMNFKIFTASSFEEGKNIFKKNKEKIDIVFTDVVLPDGNGLNLAGEFIRMKGNLCIIAASGYTNEAVNYEEITLNEYEFIQKPFGVKTLREIFSNFAEKILN